MDQGGARKRRTRADDVSRNEPQINFSQSEIASQSDTSRQTSLSRRRTRADDILKNEPQLNVSPPEIASESDTSQQTSLSRRRRTRAENVVEESEVLLTDGSENFSEDFVLSPSKITNSSTTTTINQIRAELMEEKRSSLVEAEYWDETHSWGFDDDEVSDEYWHFLGMYE